jgi:hypothetical protein
MIATTMPVSTSWPSSAGLEPTSTRAPRSALPIALDLHLIRTPDYRRRPSSIAHRRAVNSCRRRTGTSRLRLLELDFDASAGLAAAGSCCHSSADRLSFVSNSAPPRLLAPPRYFDGDQHARLAAAIFQETDCSHATLPITGPPLSARSEPERSARSSWPVNSCVTLIHAWKLSDPRTRPAPHLRVHRRGGVPVRGLI